MPIRPENRKRYPANWPAISRRIRNERAAGQCECHGECARGTHTGRCPNRHGGLAYGTGSRVILTVAHLDHQPENCDETNLRAMCQGCHLHYDRDHHRQTAAATRRAALADAGQLTFPPPAEPVRWGLIVNEVLLNATASPGRDWWTTYGARFEAQGRARILTITITGALTEYGPWDHDDAEFMQQHMTEQGLLPKAITLRKWITNLPACTGYGKCTRCGRTHTRAISTTA